MIPTSFRGADALDGLVTLVRGAVPDVLVIDGPRTRQEIPDEMVLVGWDPFSQNHVVARRDEPDLDGRMREDGEIACYIAIRRGDADMAATRARGKEVLAAIEAALRADQDDLGGSVDYAGVGGDMALTQHQTADDGASIGLPFTVVYEAWI